jgi:hypothetical protein
LDPRTVETTFFLGEEKRGKTEEEELQVRASPISFPQRRPSPFVSPEPGLIVPCDGQLGPEIGFNYFRFDLYDIAYSYSF